MATYNRNINDGFTLLDSLVIEASVADSIRVEPFSEMTVDDSVIRHHNRVLSDGITFSDDGAKKSIEKRISESIVFADEPKKNVIRALSDSMIMSDNGGRGKKLLDEMTLVDAWQSSKVAPISLSETFKQRNFANPVIWDNDILRVLPGKYEDYFGVWYGYIDRDYFWGLQSAEDWYAKSCEVSNDGYTINSMLIESTEYENDQYAQDGIYFYKVTAVYDGNQETLLPTWYRSIILDSGEDKSNIIHLQFKIEMSDFNERITALRIYRSGQYDSLYKLITTVNLGENDPNLTYVDEAFVNNGYFLNGESFTNHQYSGFAMILSYNNSRGAYRDFTHINYLFGNSSDVIYAPNADATINGEGKWHIVNINLFVPDCGWQFTVDSFTDWTLSSGNLTMERVTGGYTGNSMAYFLLAFSGTDTASFVDTISVESDTDYLFNVMVATNGATISLEYKFGTGGDWISSEDLTWRSHGDTDFANLSTVVNSGMETQLIVRIKISGYGGQSALIDSLYISRCYAYGEDNIYGGANSIVSPNFALSPSDGEVGNMVYIKNGDEYGIYPITGSAKKCLFADEISPVLFGYPVDVYKTSYYLWRESDDDDEVILDFYDNGLSDGEEHPYSKEVSINVNGQYAAIIQDRLFQANVLLDPDGTKEEHIDGYTYSEIGMPDVTPVSNFGRLPDREGGGITGIIEHYNSVVFFKKNSIYKLVLTDISNPETWQLKEGIINIGSIAPLGIVQTGHDAYFCANDGIYKLVPNFEAVSDASPFKYNRISEPINDIYLAVNDKTAIKGVYDAINNEIVYAFSATDIWRYRLDGGNWRQEDDVRADVMSIDNSGNVVVYDKINCVLNNSNDIQENSLNIKSPVYRLSDERKQLIRYFYITYQSDNDLTLNIYIDGEDTASVTKTIAANEKIEPLKIAIRLYAYEFQFEILESENSTGDVTIKEIRTGG